MNFQKISDDIYKFFVDYIITPLKTEFVGINCVINIIDIVLLTILIFGVYRFIKKRRAGKLAVGLIFIVLMTAISSLLGMRAIGLVLTNFYQVGIIAILIVFQPELRAALEKVGNTSIIARIKKIASSENRRYIAFVNGSVESICDAVFDMSREKVGALIVIERETKLGEYIDTGIKLNAALSTELLKNIFFKNAPLHDGAVIIRDLRVCAAGCFLRISEQEGLDSELGTRHRAAIGVSEVSDAAVIVVSEETGMVSLATDGSIKRGLDRETLKRELLLMLMTPASEGKVKTEKGEAQNG